MSASVCEHRLGKMENLREKPEGHEKKENN